MFTKANVRAIALGLAVAVAGFVGIGSAWAYGETVATWFQQSVVNPILVQGTDGTNAQPLKTDSSGNLNTGGNVASGATDSGNPVKVGGRYNSTLPTLTDGQRGDIQLTSKAGLQATLVAVDGTQNNAFQPSADGRATSISGFFFNNLGYSFNGSSVDRNFACTSQTSATITAAATTQIVALASSQIIRVCSVQVGISASGTFKFVNGTGSNCGTGTADITPATNLTSGNVITWGSGAASVFRVPVSNALCVAAVTGNVQVFVTYAQY